MTAEPLVLDASAAIALVRGEPAGAGVLADLRSQVEAGGEILAPELFWLELLDILVRRYRWSADAVVRAVAALDAFEPVVVAQDRPAVLLALDAALAHGLTVYDAAYLAVAQLEGARLLSLDAALVAATTSGPHRSGEERAVYGEHAARPDWRAHGRYLAELRSAAMAPVAGASQ